MAGHVMAATDAGGKRLAERSVSTEPTPGEAADYGNGHRANYVSVRHGNDDITLYGRDATGTWSILVAHAPAAVVVETRRRHDARFRPEPDWYDAPEGGFEYAPVPEGDYVMSAVDVAGGVFGERGSATAPTLAEAAELGELHEANYVLAGRRDGDVVTLYARDAGGSWSVPAAHVDVETAWEVCLWFDLTQHYRGRTSSGPGPAGQSGGHPLDQVQEPEGERLTAARAISQVVEWIHAHRLDYPTRGLTADRFDGCWSVYAPVDVDKSASTAFLKPVGRSVFLVSDVGRVKEIPRPVPPRQARELFTAEEAYVRRGLPEERFMADLRDEALRLDAAAAGPAAISSFTVDTPTPEVVAARASGLLGPIAQQLALLGPPDWDRLTAAFSCTVSGEVAQLRFWRGSRSTEVPVPEQLAVLVRRQRHLAARMPAGPWWRLLLTVSRSAGTGAQLTTDYDYGDEPLPADQLLAPERYRDDLAAYPRAQVPAWLAAHVARAAKPGTTPRTAPPATGPRQDRAARPAPVPVLDTRLHRKQLYADPHVITFGRHSLALDQVEWISYTATHTATKRLLAPTTHFSTWDFSVGRYPYHGGPTVRVFFQETGRQADQPEEWAFLVNLAKRYLEPRLLTELVARIRRGETVTIGGGMEVSQDGIACARPRLSLPWASISAAQLYNGMFVVSRVGVEKPVLTVPMSNPNAVLIPDLFAALAS